MIGYAVFGGNFQSGVVLAQYPDAIASANITGSALDPVRGLVYAQIPDAAHPFPGPPFTSSTQPALAIMDADNLTVHDRLWIPEDMTGRAVLSGDGNTLYAISEAESWFWWWGSLNHYPRLAASEDVMVQNHRAQLRRPQPAAGHHRSGRNNTAFTVTVSQPGVTPGLAQFRRDPGTGQVQVNPTAFQNQTGTTTVTLQITSQTAINLPRTVRLLVSNPSPDQRGAVIDVPGRLTDILTDQQRNRVYLLRQDSNLLLIYDGTNYAPIASVRTGTTPVRMAFAIDGQHLIVGHDNAQVAYVVDLNALQTVGVIPLPFGHYARSIAASNAATLAVARNDAEPSATGGVGAWVGLLAGPAAVRQPGFHQRRIVPASSARSLVQRRVRGRGAGAVRQRRRDSPGGGGWRRHALLRRGEYFRGVAPGFHRAAGRLRRLELRLLRGGRQRSRRLSGAGDGLRHIDGKHRRLRILGSGRLPRNRHGVVGSGRDSGPRHALQHVETHPHGRIAATARHGPALHPHSGPARRGNEPGFAHHFGIYGPPMAIRRSRGAARRLGGGQRGRRIATVGAGALISIYGQQISPVTLAASQVPLPTSLGQACVTVNGSPIPLLYISGQQINAQLPNNVAGSAALIVIAPGGVSDTFYLNVSPTAPGVFMSGTAGPLRGLATIVRWDNEQLVTPTNPIHPNDYVEIYLTGMGATNPAVAAGLAAPTNPLALVTIPPSLTLGGYPLPVTYAGLAPGLAGVYQIDAFIPFGVPQGMSVPLTISQGGGIHVGECARGELRTGALGGNYMKTIGYAILLLACRGGRLLRSRVGVRRRRRRQYLVRHPRDQYEPCR